ncbi:hypothetical protein [Streptomyces sp. 6N223]|uniref:hypothetical protein n=1 Tax=Streptomyces sp. 6N223 TaxID=3457412 RepID=UPI003FD2B5D3
MSYPDASPQADYAAAVEGLAGRVLGVLRGTQGPPASAAHVQGHVPGHVQAHVQQAADAKAGLAAVRVLGPDVLAPVLLLGAPFDAADRETVAEAFRVFPPAPGDPGEVAWRDHVTATLLARHGGGGAPMPVPSPPAALPDAADLPWPAWCALMARLSPLALPGVDGPVPEQACQHVRALSRGTARSMLRRDHPTAARLARWLALAIRRGASPELDVAAVLRHIELFGGGSARTVLDTTIARALIPDAEQDEQERRAA